MPSVSGYTPSLSVSQWQGDGDLGRRNWGYSDSSGNPSYGSGGGGSSGSNGGGGSGSSYAPVNSSNWKSMTRQQQSEWFNGRIQNSGTEFFSHPAGMAFGGIALGIITAGTILSLGIPAMIADILSLSRTEQKVESVYSTDPSKAPEGYEWRGKPGSQPGDKDGNYYNPKTGESLRPDLNHPKPKPPHWDYKDSNGKWWDIWSNGTMTPKP